MFLECLHQLNNIDDSQSLQEVFETHGELNQQLFQGSYLKPEVRKQLLKIVNEFISHLKEDNIPLDVIDYWFVGSNASYNYGPKSDIDIHIIVNMEDMGVNPYILNILYNYIKSDFNNKYDIMVKGHEVELYIEDVRSGAVTNGIYSLLKDKWVKEPIRTEILSYDVTETDEYKEWLDRYESLSENEVEDFINDLYLMRKESLSINGEWGTGNLIFKEFRNSGILQDLKNRKYKYRSKELTLEKLQEGVESTNSIKGVYQIVARKGTDEHKLPYYYISEDKNAIEKALSDLNGGKTFGPWGIVCNVIQRDSDGNEEFKSILNYKDYNIETKGMLQYYIKKYGNKKKLSSYPHVFYIYKK